MKGMKMIAVDARMFGPRRWTGIGRYVQNLAQELELLDDSHEYTWLVGPEGQTEYQPQAAHFHKTLAPEPIYSLAEQWSLYRRLARLQPDLVHFVAPNAPLLWRGRRVTTVHDLTLLDYSTDRRQGLLRMVGWLKRWVFRAVLVAGVRRSTVVLTPSHYVKDKLVERLRVPASKIVVTPLAVSRDRQEGEAPVKPNLERFGLGTDYLLNVGNCYPYKNVGLAIQALAILHKRRPQLQLVLVGRDDYFRLKLKRYAEELGVQHQVIFAGDVTDQELNALYSGAKAYVYPSLSEGFGLQGLEAMDQGVPVLAAQASCLPETCGDAAEYFDPYDANDLAAKIEAVLADARWRQRLIAAGHEHVKQYSWQQTAKLTLAAYRQALDEPKL